MFVSRKLLCRGVVGRPPLRIVALVAILGLLSTMLIRGQVLSKEYVHLNGRLVAVEAAPPLVTMLNVPAGGSYPIHTTQQTISFRVDSAGGLDHVDFFLDNLWNSDDSCYVEYWPASNTFYFSDPSDNQHSYSLGPSASPPSISNYACTLDLVHSSLTTTPTSVTMNLVITLLSSSVGNQNIYVTGVDTSYNYSLNDPLPRASWTAFDELTTAPPTYTLVNTLTSSNSQTLTFKFSDGNGFRYIDQYALAGTLNDASSTTPVQIIVQAPGYLRFQETSGSRVLAYDGNQRHARNGKGGQDDQRVEESLLAQLPDSFFLQLANGGGVRHIGGRFRTDNGKTPNYSGPYWTLFAYTPAPRAGLTWGQPLQQGYFVAIDERTSLLSEIRMVVQSSGTPPRVTQTKFNNWVQQGGQWYPGEVVRVENGQPVLTFTLQQGNIGAQLATSTFQP